MRGPPDTETVAPHVWSLHAELGLEHGCVNIAVWAVGHVAEGCIAKLGDKDRRWDSAGGVHQDPRART